MKPRFTVGVIASLLIATLAWAATNLSGDRGHRQVQQVQYLGMSAGSSA